MQRAYVGIARAVRSALSFWTKTTGFLVVVTTAPTAVALAASQGIVPGPVPLLLQGLVMILGLGPVSPFTRKSTQYSMFRVKGGTHSTVRTNRARGAKSNYETRDW